MKRRDTHDPRFLTFLNLLEKFKQDSNNRYLFLIFFIYLSSSFGTCLYYVIGLGYPSRLW